MSHIDEGALHAYLDGALDEYPAAEAKQVREHLEACAECALRLEDERHVRSAAATILGHAAPRVEAPSFEELKAYVKATRPVVGRVSVRLHRMGWAASVVLALGIGWLARGGELDRALEPGGLTGAEELEAIDPNAGAPSAPAADMLQEPAIELDATAATALGTTDAEPVPVAGRDEALGRAAAFAGPAGGGDAGTRATAPAQEAANKALGDTAPAATTAQLPEEREAAPPAQPSLSDRAAESTVLALADSVTAPALDRVAEELVAAAPASASTDSTTDEARQRADADERSRAAEAAPAPVTAQLDARPPVAPPIAGVRAPDRAEEALTLDDSAPLAIPGLQLVSYANLVEGTAPLGVHVVQRLENGEILDVYHLPEGVDPLVLPPLEAIRNEVRAEREGGWVVLRGRLTTDELRALLLRLQPEG